MVSNFTREIKTSTTQDIWLKSAILGDQKTDVIPKALTRITWNSIGESFLDKMAQDSLNLPKVGVYYKYHTLSTLYFYTIGRKTVPHVFRLGKKYTVMRAKYFPLSTKEKNGVFRATCPVSVADLPTATQIRQGSLLLMPPRPLLLNAELEGDFIEGTDDCGFIHRLPKPNTELYPGVFSQE